MSARPNEDPRRWRSAPAGEPDPDAEIGVAVRAAAEAPGWDDMRVAHVRQNILRSLANGHRAPAAGERAHRRLRIWALAVGCVLLGAVTSALAGMAVSRLVRRAVAPSTEPGAAAPPARHARRRTSLAPGDSARPSPLAVSSPADDDAADPAWAAPRPRAETAPARRATAAATANGVPDRAPAPSLARGFAAGDAGARAAASDERASQRGGGSRPTCSASCAHRPNAAAALARLDEHDTQVSGRSAGTRGGAGARRSAARTGPRQRGAGVAGSACARRQRHGSAGAAGAGRAARRGRSLSGCQRRLRAGARRRRERRCRGACAVRRRPLPPRRRRLERRASCLRVLPPRLSERSATERRGARSAPDRPLKHVDDAGHRWGGEVTHEIPD